MTDQSQTDDDRAPEGLPEDLPENLKDEAEEASEKTRQRSWDSVKLPGWAGDDLQDDLR